MRKAILEWSKLRIGFPTHHRLELVLRLCPTTGERTTKKYMETCRERINELHPSNVRFTRWAMGCSLLVPYSMILWFIFAMDGSVSGAPWSSFCDHIKMWLQFYALLWGLLFWYTPQEPYKHFSIGPRFARSPPPVHFPARYCSRRYQPSWHEKALIGNELGQVNTKLVNITNSFILGSISSSLMVAEREINKLYTRIRSSPTESVDVTAYLLRYLNVSSSTVSNLQDFTHQLGDTTLWAFVTSQSTIQKLEQISELEANETYLSMVIGWIIDSLFDGEIYLSNSRKCLTALGASLLIEHIDSIIPHIYLRKDDALNLVKRLHRLRVYLEATDKVRKRNNFQTVMQFYQTHEPHKPDSRIWGWIEAYFQARKPTTALISLREGQDPLQLILSFTKRAEVYFRQLDVDLSMLLCQLAKVRRIAIKEEGGVSHRWFPESQIRLWIRQLDSSIKAHRWPKKLPARRKIGRQAWLHSIN